MRESPVLRLTVIPRLRAWLWALVACACWWPPGDRGDAQAGMRALSLAGSPACAGGARNGAASATSGRQYDSQGRFTGRLDPDGRRYDAQGRYLGRTEQDGRQYSEQGRYLGRIDQDGRKYDSQGRYQGRSDDKGRLFDSQGRYTGRVDEEGRQFDAQGRYTGRLEGTGQATGTRPVSPAPVRVPPAKAVEANRSVAPFVFCAYGDSSCGR